jgi:hypothetical protein
LLSATHFSDVNVYLPPIIYRPFLKHIALILSVNREEWDLLQNIPDDFFGLQHVQSITIKFRLWGTRINSFISHPTDSFHLDLIALCCKGRSSFLQDESNRLGLAHIPRWGYTKDNLTAVLEQAITFAV